LYKEVQLLSAGANELTANSNIRGGSVDMNGCRKQVAANCSQRHIQYETLIFI
jgi:hypothetical protein